MEENLNLERIQIQFGIPCVSYTSLFFLFWALLTSSKRELLRGTARKMERLNKQLRTLEKPRWGFHGERALANRSANGVLKDRKSGQTKPLTLIAVR